MTVEELFGTLQESVTAEWRKHLQTGKYSKHMCLDDYYKEMPEKIDALIEAYQADNDIVKDYKNVLDDSLDALTYMQELKKTVKEGRKLFEGESELESLTDDILGLIDSTIYKLKHLKESMSSLSDYIKENIDVLELTVNEALTSLDDVKAQIIKWIEDGGKSLMADRIALYKAVKKLKLKKCDKNSSSYKWIGFEIKKADDEWGGKKGDIQNIAIYDERNKDLPNCGVQISPRDMKLFDDVVYGTNSFTFLKNRFYKTEVYDVPLEFADVILAAANNTH